MSIYSHAADEILRFGSKFQQEFKGVIGKGYEKKTRAINETKDDKDIRGSSQNIIQIKRDPIMIKSKNSLDFSTFDTPKSSVGATKDIERFRNSNRENEFLQLDLTKPEKKDIILVDRPDLDPDDQMIQGLYQQAFDQKPPDEDVLGYSMNTVKRSMKTNNSLKTHSIDPNEQDETYQRQM